MIYIVKFKIKGETAILSADYTCKTSLLNPHDELDEWLRTKFGNEVVLLGWDEGNVANKR